MERGLPGLITPDSEKDRCRLVETGPHPATIVPEACRLQFLPTMFGRSLLIIGENAVYSLMERFSPLDYHGGFWDFYEHEGKPLFLAPKTSSRFRITGGITGFQGEVSAEVAGIIATLFAFASLLPLPVRLSRGRLWPPLRLFGRAPRSPEISFRRSIES